MIRERALNVLLVLVGLLFLAGSTDRTRASKAKGSLTAVFENRADPLQVDTRGPLGIWFCAN